MRTALLVPCYNAVRFLPRLRAQVERLQPAFDEVLLADDASTDATAEQAAALGFRVLRLPSNRGPGGARNALAQAATAEWIHFHDVDDEIAPDYLAHVLPAAGPAADAVLHSLDFIRESDRHLIRAWRTDAAGLARDPAEQLLRFPLPTSASFLRRALFLQLGGFDEQHRCFEDGDFHFRMAASGARLVSMPDVLGWSLRHDGGASANQRYCYGCRVDYLESYADQHARLHPAIAAEAEYAAAQLLRYGDRPNAERAIALGRRLGRTIPSSHSVLVRMLRPILPAATLLGWQDRWRRHQQSPDR